MNKRDDGSGFIAVGIMIVFFLIAAIIMEATTPRCIKSDCDRERAERSDYCYLHKPRLNKSLYRQEFSHNDNLSSTANKSYSKRNNYSSDSYDAGYEDVYENEDYNWDRYCSDDDYANGVDDAMEELNW